MIRPTAEILKEALDELTDTIDYVCSESGDTNISKWLQEVEGKLVVVYNRLANANTVRQQEDT